MNYGGTVLRGKHNHANLLIQVKAHLATKLFHTTNVVKENQSVVTTILVGMANSSSIECIEFH